jgi:hypothetical protein
VHISKNENVKEYWRLKPPMDAAQMLPPTEASETCMLCVLRASFFRDLLL